MFVQMNSPVPVFVMTPLLGGAAAAAVMNTAELQTQGVSQQDSASDCYNDNCTVFTYDGDQ